MIDRLLSYVASHGSAIVTDAGRSGRAHSRAATSTATTATTASTRTRRLLAHGTAAGRSTGAGSATSAAARSHRSRHWPRTTCSS
ncbi:hypothetical protein [Lentzea guizhouensis]|uniref:hypothetical protein n=1 Tax=Lentzea guizhouensis TaxID=1586287 RepID=UPI00147293EC|nr:hypothetical protein [Lentzea guizhouensis]